MDGRQLLRDEQRSIGRRMREARESLGLSRAQLAERLRVHAGSIARWETGGTVPQSYHMERLAEWAGTTVGWLRYGEGVGIKSRIRTEQARAAADVFTSLDAITRFLDGIAPAGEQKARKLDALEGYRRMLTARGSLPDWWYRVRDMVENEQL
jgi:transcriptional regulator with XRE-family HTH domain